MRKKLIAAYAAKLSREWGRPASAADAEAEIVRTIRVVARNLAGGNRFVFGYHTREDIEQQVSLFALEALEVPGRYDVSRPLGNFLYVHCKNGLHNLKRDTFMRCEPPCGCCDAFGDPPEPCRRWREWAARNSAKQALMSLDPLGPVDTRDDTDVVEDAAARELMARIDDELAPELRSDYHRMLDRVHVPKARRLLVRGAIEEILTFDPQ